MIDFTVSTVGLAFTKLPAQYMNKVMKDTLADLGDWWYSNITGKKFTDGAKTEYNHFPRTFIYQRRKEESGHGSIDGVYTGSARDTLKCFRRITGSKDKVVVGMRRPRVWNIAGQAATLDDRKRWKVDEIRAALRQKYPEWTNAQVAWLADNIVTKMIAKGSLGQKARVDGKQLEKEFLTNSESDNAALTDQFRKFYAENWRAMTAECMENKTRG